MTRLCIKAGIEPWPKIFQNLRSTRQTILEQHYPRGTVCAWMGNTDDIAEAHYVQEQKEFRQQAALKPTTDVSSQGDSVDTTDTKREKVVQNPVQKSTESGRTLKNGSVSGIPGIG